MNLWSLIPLTSCVAFAVLFALIIQQARTRQNKLFAIFIFASGVWSFTSFMLTYNTSASTSYLNFWNGLVYAAVPLVVITYYHFIRAYNNRSGGLGVYVGYPLVLALLILCLLGYVIKNAYMVNGYIYHDIKPWDYVLAGIVIPYLIIIFSILVRRYRHSVDAIDRNKTAYLMGGWSMLLVISYITPFTPALAGLPIDHIGNLLNALIIAYAISRFRLLDIRFVLRRGIALVITLIPIVALYIGGIYFMFQFYPGLPFYSILILTVFLTLVLALVSLPIRRPLQAFIDRVFWGDTYDSRQELIGFTSKMGNILNLDQLAGEMLQTLSNALKVKKAVLLIEDPSTSTYNIRYLYPEEDGSAEEIKILFDSPVVTWLRNETSVLTVRRIETEPQFKALWESEKESLVKSNLQLFCPLKSHGKLVGILGLSNKRPNRIYTQEDIELIMSVANQAGVIVENAQLYSQAMTWAITDGLTRLHNHRYMHECLDKEIARGSRFGATFSLIMIDLDFFKTYNDTYGHLAGDEVLIGVGKCIQSSLREVDTSFRYGGEEFAVILPETTTEGAFIVAERIREKIENILPNGKGSVTASLGIATWPSDGVTKEQMLLSADKALYTAKETGRNRTCVPYDVKREAPEAMDVVSETQKLAIGLIFALAATVDAKDHYTYGHSKKVSEYSVAMAQLMHLSQEDIGNIRNAGLLHDIGKIGIPDSILNKNGQLDEEEWGYISRHPEMGAEILRYVSDLANTLPIIMHHHEHYDGSGYPSGTKEQDIPLGARILAIADAYDAMTSLRPYHRQRSSEEAIEELKRCAGTHFDPELVNIFCKGIQSIITRDRGKRLTS